MRETIRLGCGVVVLRKERILLLQRNRQPDRHCWSIPGGKVDPREDIMAAALRELAEETGLEAQILSFLTYSDDTRPAASGVERWIGMMFLAEAVGEPRILEPEAHAALDWFPLEAPPVKLTPQTRVALRAVIHGGTRANGRAIG